MKGLHLPKIDLNLPLTTKFYIASAERKLYGQEALVSFILARNLIYIQDLQYLNKDSAIATVHYNSDSNLDLAGRTNLPFKFSRVFKSYHGRQKPVPLSFMGNTAVNLLRIAKERGGKHLIQVESDKISYFKQFSEVAFKELDSDPAGYKEIDFSPRGETKFVIRHFDHADGSYSIVSWVEGPNWSN